MAGIEVGDTVSKVNGTHVGIVVEVLEPQIYDRCMRIVVQWQRGYHSYEKESSLEKLS